MNQLTSSYLFGLHLRAANWKCQNALHRYCIRQNTSKQKKEKEKKKQTNTKNQENLAFVWTFLLAYKLRVSTRCRHFKFHFMTAATETPSKTNYSWRYLLSLVCILHYHVICCIFLPAYGKYSQYCTVLMPLYRHLNSKN